MDRTRIDDLDTPCLIVDLRLFEANVARCMERLAGVDVRPHLKTAKSPAVARLLLDAGAVGICVAKLGEAEVMLDAGIDDVMITTELVGPAKLRRLVALRERWPEASLRVVVDSWEGALRPQRRPDGADRDADRGQRGPEPMWGRAGGRDPARRPAHRARQARARRPTGI